MNNFFKTAIDKLKTDPDSKYVDEIVANKDVSPEAALKKMNKAVEKYGITKEEYVKQCYYLLKDEHLEKLLTIPYFAGRVDYAAEKFGVPRGKLYAKACKVQAKYGVPLYKYVSDDLYKATSKKQYTKAKLEVDKDRADKVKELADITGWSLPEMRKYLADIYTRFGAGIDYVKDYQLFKMSDEEIEETLKTTRADDAARIEKIKKANNWDAFDLERHRCLCRYRYGIYVLKTYDNIECWKYSTDELDTFAIPGDAIDMRETYDTVSTEILDNKILFDQTYSEFLGRKFWINRDTSIEEFKEFIDGLKYIFCKPINLLGGHGSYKYEITDNIEEMYDFFMKEPKMLIEEVPEQHHLFSEIYPNSINSIRITNVIKDGKCIPFLAWIKFGGKGSVVDGRVDGGCFAGVDVKTGIVDSLAIDIDNNRFANHQDTGKQITGFQIPYWQEALDLAERALRHVDGIDFVGWDLCMTENGPIIVEGNSRPAFSDIQLLYNYEGSAYPGGQRWRYIDLLEDPDKRRRAD